MQEIFATSDIVAIMDPVYPVYVDSNVMAGRSGKFVNGSYENLSTCRVMKNVILKQTCHPMIP